MCISIFVFVCTHILNNLSHVLTNHNEFIFVKPFLTTKTFLLFFVTFIYLEHPSKSKEKYELFSISNFMKTFDELPVNPKSIDRVYKFLFDLGLINNPSFELNYSIMHQFNLDFHETQKLNVNTSFKILSKLEPVSLVK